MSLLAGNTALAQLTDASYASGSVLLGINSSAYSNYLYIQHFGFAIPASATICKIVVEVQREVTGFGLFVGSIFFPPTPPSHRQNPFIRRPFVGLLPIAP